MKVKFCVSALTLVLVGCAQNMWVKNGATQEDYGRDRLSCLQQSQQIESRSGTSASANSAYGSYESKSRTGAVTNTSIFNACMNSKGWVLKNSSEVAEQNSRKKVVDDEKRDQINMLRSQMVGICDRDEYVAFTSKTSCGDKSTTLAMLADNTKINANQKKAMDGYTEEWESLMNQQEKLILRTADAKLRSRIQCTNDKIKPLFRKNDLDLYTGRITWGQYNKTKNDLRTKMKSICTM